MVTMRHLRFFFFFFKGKKVMWTASTRISTLKRKSGGGGGGEIYCLSIVLGYLSHCLISYWNTEAGTNIMWTSSSADCCGWWIPIRHQLYDVFVQFWHLQCVTCKACQSSSHLSAAKLEAFWLTDGNGSSSFHQGGSDTVSSAVRLFSMSPVTRVHT